MTSFLSDFGQSVIHTSWLGSLVALGALAVVKSRPDSDVTIKLRVMRLAFAFLLAALIAIAVFGSAHAVTNTGYRYLCIAIGAIVTLIVAIQVVQLVGKYRSGYFNPVRCPITNEDVFHAWQTAWFESLEHIWVWVRLSVSTVFFFHPIVRRLEMAYGTILLRGLDCRSDRLIWPAGRDTISSEEELSRSPPVARIREALWYTKRSVGQNPLFGKSWEPQSVNAIANLTRVFSDQYQYVSVEVFQVLVQEITREIMMMREDLHQRMFGHWHWAISDRDWENVFGTSYRGEAKYKQQQTWDRWSAPPGSITEASKRIDRLLEEAQRRIADRTKPQSI